MHTATLFLLFLPFPQETIPEETLRRHCAQPPAQDPRKCCPLYGTNCWLCCCVSSFFPLLLGLQDLLTPSIIDHDAILDFSIPWATESLY